MQDMTDGSKMMENGVQDYVLFSPLGRTDPTRGLYDGAFIHICRVYKPKKAYLYMSQEICRFDDLDNRYENYLNKLTRHLEFECTAVKLRHEQLVNVHDFERFYEDFTGYIRNISEENPDCKILLNLSSGTPQMKSALRIVSSLSSLCLIPIQVSTPHQKSNEERPVGAEYDIEAEWELNEDNRTDFVNRCSVVKSENFNAMIKREIISRHIAAYDYRAALSVAETIPEHISRQALALIKAGCLRLSLDIGQAVMLAQSAGFKLIPKGFKEQTTIDAYEYILNMQIKLEKGELADFLRAVSPILTHLFETYLTDKCGIDIKSYYKKPYKTEILSRDLLPADLQQILDAAFGA